MILINKFNVKHEEADQFLKMWEKDATLRANTDIFQLSSIEELVVAVYSSTMQFGNLLHYTRHFFG
jgi:hypothetical protein